MNLDTIDYVPAANGPINGPVDNRVADIVVMHSMECPPDNGHVTNWVKSLSSSTGREFYAHYYVGPSVVYRVAPLGRTVWHCGNGNQVGGLWTLGIEQAGYAAQTRQQWIDCGVVGYTKQLLEALLAAGHGSRRWLTVDDLKTPGVRGVTSHNNIGQAFGGSDHTDPGPEYPHDLLLADTGHLNPTGEPVNASIVVQTPVGGYKEYLIYPSGTAVYLRTAADTNLAIFCGAADRRSIDGTPFLRISAASTPAI